MTAFPAKVSFVVINYNKQYEQFVGIKYCVSPFFLVNV